MRARQGFARDHPRGCGEHYCHSVIVDTPMGSSPRMRGAPYVATKQLTDPRIIPADAGSTRAFRRFSPPKTDHPRGCGEHAD